MSDPATLFRVPPPAYFRPDVLAREMESVFRRAWVCVGYRKDLVNPDDFVTHAVGGYNVVVQNFAGELRAFQNKCSHRHTVLQADACGNRALVCPYHGWSYNERGVPVGIPHNKEFFGFDAPQKESLRLKSFEVGTRGPFVFVKIEPGPPTLDDYLGDVAGLLDQLPDVFVSEFGRGVMAWKTNWKIAVESVLEGYHVETTHATSFNDVLDCRNSPITLMGRHALQATALSANGAAWWDALRQRLKLRSFFDSKSYWHLFVFPNLAIGVAGGALLTTQTYWPTDPEESSLEFRLWLADAHDAAALNNPVRKGSYQSLSAQNQTILGEDRQVSELSQRGLREAEAPGIFGVSEVRLRHFHESIAQYTGGLE